MLNVISLHCAVLIPALLVCKRVFYGNAPMQQQGWVLFVALMQPAAVLIDHGHFQYNSISLGMAVSLLHVISMTHKEAVSPPSCHTAFRPHIDQLAFLGRLALLQQLELGMRS